MRNRTGSVLLAGLVLGCSPNSGSTFHTRQATTGSDDAGGGSALDASQQAADAAAPLVCPAACPTAEPAEGDMCDLGEECEYGDAGPIECNRVYFCLPLGVFQKWKFVDTSVCAPGLAAGCPAMRASAKAGSACGSEGLRCAYAEGECSCTQGAWHCFPDNPQLGVAHCTTPRPRLGTTCSPQTDSCEYEPICRAEACSGCSRWQMVPFAFGCPTDAGMAADTGPAVQDGGPLMDAATPRDSGTKRDGQAKLDGGADGGH